MTRGVGRWGWLCRTCVGGFKAGGELQPTSGLKGVVSEDPEGSVPRIPRVVSEDPNWGGVDLLVGASRLGDQLTSTDGELGRFLLQHRVPISQLRF